MSQIARPDADVADGSWTKGSGGNTDMFEEINEVTPSDTDYIRSENDPSSSQCSIGLENLVDPKTTDDGASHIIRYRYRKQMSGGGAPGTIDVTVELQHSGGTASNTHNGISETWTLGSFTLTNAQANAITDYTSFQLNFTANKSAGARTSWGEFSWAEFEAPSPGGGTEHLLPLLGVG